MSADGTLRRRAKVAALVAKRKGEEPAGGPGLLLRGFLWLEPRTALCLLCVAACAVLTGLMFQQTASFANDVKHLQLLQMKDAELITLKERLRLVSEKCGKCQDMLQHLMDLQLMNRVSRLQKSVSDMGKWSGRITAEKKQLQRNVTALFQAATNIEQRTTSSTKDVFLKVTALKTDVRRISGLQLDAKILTDSVQDLEMRMEKMERKTAQSIGDMLASSIEHVMQLKNSALRNENRMKLVKERIAELENHFSKYSTKLLDLEGDRMKLLRTVTFANDLKPTVHSLKQDFSLLEPVLNDLVLRIGKLASDLLQRERDITSLNKNCAALQMSDMKEMK